MSGFSRHPGNVIYHHAAQHQTNRPSRIMSCNLSFTHPTKVLTNYIANAATPERDQSSDQTELNHIVSPAVPVNFLECTCKICRHSC